MIKIESQCYGYSSVTALLSLSVVSILVAFMVYYGHFTSFTTFSTGSKFEYDSVPMIPFQITASTSDQIRAVRFDEDNDDHRSSNHKASNVFFTNQFKNSTPIGKTKQLNREEGLARARSSILKAASWSSSSFSSDGNLSLAWKTANGGQIYRNPRAFYQSYLEMERRFKVFVYEEGDLPLVHDGPCKNLYTIEGRFIHEMEHGASTRKFRTKNPLGAHVYFMPFSVTWMVKYVYKPLTYNLTSLKQFVSDYVNVVSTKYSFWNRTNGADHFMLACHDWGPHASQGNPNLYNKSIRALCNANTTEGFNPLKDVSIPEIHLYSGKMPSKLLCPPPQPTNTTSRPHLAFFAGGLHGPIRPILLHHWKDRDDDNYIKVFEYLPKGQDYYSFMLQSKFCLCPSGHEVASPRIVEAIYAECVPVILSEHYVLPFSDVLRWEAFSIQMEVSDIPRLKEVLGAIPDDKYKKLQRNLRVVRRHFMLNQPAKRYDVFHMILHSIWLRRINLRLE